MWTVLHRAIGGFWKHGCVTHGAALAFYALFVLAGLVSFPCAPDARRRRRLIGAGG